MDGGAVVEQTAATEETATVAQAIFTSIRSPMGQGYRLIAASRGITADEQREIVQRAPSHGSLCDPAPGAAALASFTLRSGRPCVFLAQNADAESSARGGCRVHTHVLVMDPAVFERFDCDPLKLRAAALRAIDGDWLNHPPTRIEALPLSIVTDSEGTPAEGALTRAEADRTALILAAVLSGQRLLVFGMEAVARILRCVLDTTPVSVRRQLSVTCDLKFSPSRPFQLNLAGAADGELGRIIRDDRVTTIDWQSPPVTTESPFQAWVGFASRRWQAGRSAELNRLAVRLTQEHTPHALERLATLCSDIELTRQADEPSLELLAQKYAQGNADSEAYNWLLTRFHTAVEIRRTNLMCRAQASATGDKQGTACRN